jgi:hypothetical protein
MSSKYSDAMSWYGGAEPSAVAATVRISERRKPTGLSFASTSGRCLAK